MLVWAVSPALAAPPKPLTPEQDSELRTLCEQLSDASRARQTKRDAASLLLIRSYPQAKEALVGFLSDPANRPAQIAIAEVLAANGQGHAEFIEPLAAMLRCDEPAVRAPAARALAACKLPAAAAQLVDAAADRRADTPVRIAAIEALQFVLDKEAVNTLIHLLDDRSPPVREAAFDSLERLANRRDFGRDRAKWKRWWALNADRPRDQWLSELADSLARTRHDLEAANARLRERLVRATEDLYLATPASQRDTILATLLEDPLGDVRATGVRLIERKIAAAESVNLDLQGRVRTLLDDPDPRVRRACASVLGRLSGPEALEVLLARVEAESDLAVREELLTALGQHGDAKALPAIVGELERRNGSAATAAAARALARIAERLPLSGDDRAGMQALLLQRHTETLNGEAPAAVREALLAAMGVIGSPDFAPVLIEALQDASAVVRLAAVNGLLKMGDPARVDAIASLAADSDRGVRQAVIVALRTLDGRQHLDAFLRRTDPTEEPDPGVRQQAWTAVMAVLETSEPDTIGRVAASLARRSDPGEQLIRVRLLHVAALRRAESPQLPRVLCRLGEDLLAANRPAEAAVHLRDAYSVYATAADPNAPHVWGQWIDALLAAENPAAVKAIADQADPNAFASAVDRLCARIDSLLDAGRVSPAFQIGTAAPKLLGERLTPEQRQRLEQCAAAARARQQQVDRERVAALIPRLMAMEDSTRTAALQELQALGDRALPPLLGELRKFVAADPPNPEAEKALLNILKQIAPRLDGYDTAAPRAQRLERIDGWLNG